MGRQQQRYKTRGKVDDSNSLFFSQWRALRKKKTEKKKRMYLNKGENATKKKIKLKIYKAIVWFHGCHNQQQSARSGEGKRIEDCYK